MKKLLYFSIFFLIFTSVFAANRIIFTSEAENILKAILNLLQKNTTTPVITPQLSTSSEILQEWLLLPTPSLPKNVKPAVPTVQPINPEVIKSILPDEDREDDVIIQINNLRITRIVTSTTDAKAIIFAVRDTGWKCLFYKSEESSISLPCALNLRKPILERELVIKVVDDTILLFRNRKRGNIEDFQIGDKINVYGFMDKDNYGIEGLIIRNLSKSYIKKVSSFKEFKGYIILDKKENCPLCVYNNPPCALPCQIIDFYFLLSKDDDKKYELIFQNNQAKENLKEYLYNNSLVIVNGILKENKILVNKIYQQPTICPQVITPAKNLETGESKKFSTPCEIPVGWEIVENCFTKKLPKQEFCLMVITPARNLETGECKEFHDSCIPPGWKVDYQCRSYPVHILPEIEKIEEIKVEADDYGFYPSEITVSRDSKISLIFVVRQSNVYYGGLDFRSEKFKTETVKPGETTKVEFVADKSFVISSYWPLSGVKKADLKVIIK